MAKKVKQNPWSLQQWDDLTKRLQVETKVENNLLILDKEKNLNGNRSYKSTYVNYGLHTTPLNDSIFMYDIEIDNNGKTDYRNNFVIKNSETGNWTSSSDVNDEYYEVEGVDEKDLPAPARIAINTIRNRFNTKGNGGLLEVLDTKSKLIPKRQSFRKFLNSGKIEMPIPEEYLNVVDPRTHLISSVISQDSRTRIKNNKLLNQSATLDFTLDEVDDGSTVFSGSKDFNNYGKPANHRIYHKNNLDGTIDYSYYVNGEIMNHGENIQPDLMNNMARYLYESMLNSLKNRIANVYKKEN